MYAASIFLFCFDSDFVLNEWKKLKKKNKRQEMNGKKDKAETKKKKLNLFCGGKRKRDFVLLK